MTYEHLCIRLGETTEKLPDLIRVTTTDDEIKAKNLPKVHEVAAALDGWTVVHRATILGEHTLTAYRKGISREVDGVAQGE